MSVILGKPILKEVELNFNTEGIIVKLYTPLTILIDHKEDNDKYEPERTEDTEELHKIVSNPEAKKQSNEDWLEKNI